MVKPYPHVIIIGAQKCGTTTLHMSLIKHSGITEPVDPISKMPVKEIDFFFRPEIWSNGVDWYWAHYNQGSGLSLDTSPNYLVNPLSYRRIYEVVPDAKIIITLRNPVDRAYSQYNHYVQELPVSRTYDWDYKMDFTNNIYHQLNKRRPKNLFYGMVYKGIYIEQINLLLKYFNRDQMYITVMDKWEAEYQTEMNNILTFLGLSIEQLPGNARHKRNYFVEPRNENTIKLLRQFYKPYNEQLFEFLGYDIPDWTSEVY
jgi:hypothetical protein